MYSSGNFPLLVQFLKQMQYIFGFYYLKIKFIESNLNLLIHKIVFFVVDFTSWTSSNLNNYIRIHTNKSVY